MLELGGGCQTLVGDDVVFAHEIVLEMTGASLERRDPILKRLPYHGSPNFTCHHGRLKLPRRRLQFDGLAGRHRLGKGDETALVQAAAENVLIFNPVVFPPQRRVS